MKLRTFKTARPNTTYLQGFGYVEGTPAADLTVGSTLVWNNGSFSKVVDIVKQTDKTITVLEEYEDDYSPTGKSTYERRLLKKRIVARPADELPGADQPEPQPEPQPEVFNFQIPVETDIDGAPGESVDLSGDSGVIPVIVIRSGEEVDLVTNLFDAPYPNGRELTEIAFDELTRHLKPAERDALLNGDWVDSDILKVTGPIGKPEQIYPKTESVYYPNQVVFDRVVDLYPGFKVVGVEEFYSANIGWRKPEEVVSGGELGLDFWAPEELVQYLFDSFEGVTFCLIIEDKDGRRKNPDYRIEQLFIGFEPEDEVLYIPNHANEDRRHPDCQKGTVSSVRADKGKAKVWVRYTSGVTGALTDLKNLIKF